MQLTTPIAYNVTVNLCTSVANPKVWVGQKYWGGGILDFRQITLFCLGYRLSRHKMTISSKNLGSRGPLAAPMARNTKQERKI